MSNTNTCNWPGKSGKTYQYWIYPIATASFKSEGGNYIFCKETTPGNWTPQYIGQTNDLDERLGDHEKEACAKRNGATHIHAHTNSSKADRLTEEKDLILNFKPPCNDQHAG